MLLLTDKRVLDAPERADIMLTVPAEWARGIYTNGAAEIKAALPAIEQAGKDAFRNETGVSARVSARLLEGKPDLDLSKAAGHLRHAKNRVFACESCARVLTHAVGTVTLPSMEVSALMALTDGSTLEWLLNPLKKKEITL